jgi:hypothetical protein
LKGIKERQRAFAQRGDERFSMFNNINKDAMFVLTLVDVSKNGSMPFRTTARSQERTRYAKPGGSYLD